MKYLNFYDLQLFKPLIGDYKRYRIKMPMFQGDVDTQIVLFLLRDRGSTRLLWNKNEKPRFFQKRFNFEDL